MQVSGLSWSVQCAMCQILRMQYAVELETLLMARMEPKSEYIAMVKTWNECQHEDYMSAHGKKSIARKCCSKPSFFWVVAQHVACRAWVQRVGCGMVWGTEHARRDAYHGMWHRTDWAHARQDLWSQHALGYPSVSSHENENNIAHHPCIDSVPSCVLLSTRVRCTVFVVTEPTLRPW